MTVYTIPGNSDTVSIDATINWRSLPQSFVLQTHAWKANIAINAMMTVVQMATPRHLLCSRALLTVAPTSHGAKTTRTAIVSRKELTALPFLLYEVSAFGTSSP